MGTRSLGVGEEQEAGADFDFGRCGSGNGGGCARCIIRGGVSACILWGSRGEEGEGSLYPES